MAELVGAIVARNGGALLREALADLLAACGADNVLVVDNASTDGATVDLPVAVLRQPRNRGYAGGANVALEWAGRRGATGLLLLNQDARLTASAAPLLLAHLRGDANVGAVFAKVVRRDRPYLLDGLAGRRNLRHKLTTALGSGALARPVSPWPRAVHHGHGAALLLRVDAARAVGGFDPALVAYHDEVDLCWRLARAHWTVMLEPRATVRHVGKEDDPARQRAKAYLLARNSLVVAAKNAGRFGLARVAVWAAAATLLYYGPTALTGDKLARAFVRGWLDGLRGRPVAQAVWDAL